MSAIEQIQSTAESAILELESEIIDIEEKIEAHKLRIQSARVQIQALKKFLSPEEDSHPRASRKNGKSHTVGIELQ